MPRNKKKVPRDLSMVQLTKKNNYPFCDFVKISSCSTIRRGHIDPNRHMNTQTHSTTYRPKQHRGQVSVLGIFFNTD